MGGADDDGPVRRRILEVQGRFPGNDALQAPIAGLEHTGYVRADAEAGRPGAGSRTARPP